MLRVLVADADPDSRAGWVALLEAEKDVRARGVARADTLLQRAASADVVVLVAGEAVRPRVAELLAGVQDRSSTPVVVLTPVEAPEVLEEALARGAAGALVADATPIRVVAAVRAAADGERLESDTGMIPVTGPLVQRVAHDASPLTEKEIEILALADDGLSTQDIADRLYVSVSTVKSHLSHAFGRLGVRHRAAAVAEARRQGLL